MLLVIDIGNTNINIGIYDNDSLIKIYKISSDKTKTVDEFGILLSLILSENKVKDKIKSVVISSVVLELSDIIQNAVREYFNIEAYNVSYKSKLPITIKINEPKEAGADRIANASAAAMLYKLPAIVIDIGTATTFDIVDRDKNFIGGIIAPGPLIQARSLSKFTSKLPKLNIEAPKNAIGKNTIDAMLSGVVYGHEKMIEGMIEKCEEELQEKATIIVTGGLSNILFKDFKFDFKIDKNLTLEGSKIIWEMNRE